MKKFITALAVALTVSAGAVFAGDYGNMEKKNIVETAVAAGSFNTLAAALQAADLVDTLSGEGPFTVFAPTDEAFAKLPAGTVESLLKPENKDQLIAVLTYHVVSGSVTSDQVVTLDSAATVNGASVSISTNDGAVHRRCGVERHDLVGGDRTGDDVVGQDRD